MVYIGVKKPTDPITFDPNFQQDIQVGNAIIPMVEGGSVCP